jgi:hypothetical protein
MARLFLNSVPYISNCTSGGLKSDNVHGDYQGCCQLSIKSYPYTVVAQCSTYLGGLVEQSPHTSTPNYKPSYAKPDATHHSAARRWPHVIVRYSHKSPFVFNVQGFPPFSFAISSFPYMHHSRAIIEIVENICHHLQQMYWGLCYLAAWCAHAEASWPCARPLVTKQYTMLNLLRCMPSDLFHFPRKLFAQHLARDPSNLQRVAVWRSKCTFNRAQVVIRTYRNKDKWFDAFPAEKITIIKSHNLRGNRGIPQDIYSRQPQDTELSARLR